MNPDGKCLSREVTKFTQAGRIIHWFLDLWHSTHCHFECQVVTKIKIYYIILLLENVKCSQDNQTHLREGNSLNIKWVTAFIEGSL